MRPRRGLPLLIAASLLLGGGAGACHRNVEPFVEGEEPREPDLSRIFPAGAEEEGPAGQRLGMGMAGQRTGAPAAAPAGSAEPGAISGEIRLSEAAQPIPGAILFVIARTAGARGGPPLAVLRIPDPRFPQVFAIGPENVMIPSLRFEGPIQLSARLDRDGNAMTRDDADLEAATSSSLQPGAEGVELLLQ